MFGIRLSEFKCGYMVAVSSMECEGILLSPNSTGKPVLQTSFVPELLVMCYMTSDLSEFENARDFHAVGVSLRREVS